MRWRMSTKPYYQDAAVTIWHGDCRDMIGSIDFDALVTDPPYSSGGMVRGDRAGAGSGAKYVTTGSAAKEIPDFSGDNRDQRGYAYWLTLWLSECLRIVKPQGVALLFTDWRQLPAPPDALQAGGWVWRGIVPWYKPASRPQAGRFAASCEYVVWGSQGGMTTDLTSPCLPGFYQASPPRNREHVTQKPVEVMRELVKIAPPGGVVLDPFAGSGTTGVAALIEGRRFVGVEQHKHFAAVAAARLRETQGLARDEQSSIDFGGVA